MGTIRQLANAFSSVSFGEIVQESIELTKGRIIDYNRQQLYTGLTSFNSKITPQYANPLYAINKEKQNPVPGFMTPDLYLTGSFYAGIQVVVSRKEFTTSSNDSKAAQLESKYGTGIYGLSPLNASQYALNDLYPVIFEELKAQTVGG